MARTCQVLGTVECFDEFALESGTDARAMACVKLRAGDKVGVGVSFARDTTSATLQAVVNALHAQLTQLVPSVDVGADGAPLAVGREVDEVSTKTGRASSTP